ncbi:hypothetical protein [Chitinophaga pinensis]
MFRQHICCLPQLGVFRLTHTPARYDVTSKTILPPERSLLLMRH